MITEEEFQRLVHYIKSEAGIDLTQKRVLVTTRLENYIANSEYENLGEYLNQAISNKAGKENENLINILTTNHTFFWREQQHFEFLLHEVLPEIKKKCQNTKDIRTWCAASSSGEEPYTLAMIMMEFFGIEYNEWDTTILATDISTKVLGIANKGIYAADAIKPLPESWQRKYFKAEGEIVHVKEELKMGVLFSRLNLVDQYPFRKKLNIVFCRNVLIYFDDELKNQIINKIVDNLEIGGYLFIGTTESVGRNNKRLEYVVPSVYRRIM